MKTKDIVLFILAFIPFSAFFVCRWFFYNTTDVSADMQNTSYHFFRSSIVSFFIEAVFYIAILNEK